MAVQKIYDYEVAGRGSFPLDMLRYDCAWPAREAELPRLTYSLELRQIKIRSNKAPTEDRWASFGWRIINRYETKA